MSGIEARIEEGVPLAPKTSLELGGPARFYLRARSDEELIEGLGWAEARGLPAAILGGGSNLLVGDRGFDGLVIEAAQRGLAIDEEGRVEAAAGEPWDPLVAATVEAGLAGLECLGGIPGRAGATPIQNVGAYGQEVSQTIESVRVYDRKSRLITTFENRECGFDYRDSFFKQRLGDQVVLGVLFRLRPGGAPSLRYGELTRAFEDRAFEGRTPSLREVHAAVIALRRSKSMVWDLEDPNRRSAGSFFTNPIVEAAQAERVVLRALEEGIVADAREVPRWPAGEGRVKLAAGWLIERAGLLKGTRVGRVGLSSAHALALVHHGGGTASELLAFARSVRDRVLERFEVALVPEPRFWGIDEDF